MRQSETQPNFHFIFHIDASHSESQFYSVRQSIAFIVLFYDWPDNHILFQNPEVIFAQFL